MPPRARVRVPGSSANLGAGFDALGLALDLYTTASAEIADATTITVTGEGQALLSCGPDNLLLRNMRALAARCGRELPPIRIHIHNDIPIERGIGASGAATVAGLLLADALLDTRLDRSALLDLACEIERHPDNVVPSLLGGCTIAALDGDRVIALPVPLPPDLVCVLCIPDVRMPTQQARSVMPASYSRADVVFNLSRTGLFVAALATGQLDALRIGVQDRVHQPYRAAVFPALLPLIAAAEQAGAWGAFLSGAGSTVAALADRGRAEAVARTMAATGIQHDLHCRTLVTTIDRRGAVIDHDERG